MRDCHAVLTRRALHLRFWREKFISRAARFSPNAVIIKTYCSLKIELSFLDIHNNFFLSRIQGPVPERRNNSIPGINVPYSRDNFMPGINSVPERRNSAIQGINLR